MNEHPLRAHVDMASHHPGEWMESRATLTPAGRLEAIHHLWTNDDGHGYTGGAVVFLIGDAEQVIGTTPMRTYSPAAAGTPGTLSSIAAIETDEFGPEIGTRTKQVVILLRDEPTSQLIEDIRAGYYVGRSLAEVYGDVANNGRAGNVTASALTMNVRFRVNNGMYLCAEHSGGEAIVANRPEPGTWETFRLFGLAGDVLTSGDAIALSSNNGMYVCDNAGLLRATDVFPTAAGSFVLEHADGSHGPIKAGDQVTLRVASGRFVSAVGGGGGDVGTTSEAVAAPETFGFETVEDLPISVVYGPASQRAGRWIDSRVTLLPSGRAEAQHHLWATGEDGFTASVAVFFVSRASTVTGAMTIRRYEVPGLWTVGASNVQTAIETEQLSRAIYLATSRVVVVPRLDPSATLIDDINADRYTGRPIADVYLDLARNGGAPRV